MPAAAQDHATHDRGAKDHSAQGHASEQVASQTQADQPKTPEPFVLPEMTGQTDHSDHSDHASIDLPSGPPPHAALEGPAHAADAVWGAERMAAARAANHAEHGGMTTGIIMVERLEARIADGHDAYLWDVQGWYGGDIDKFVLKSEGEGDFVGSIDDAEVQALWGHAIGPYFDLQAGVRLDLQPDTRSHLAVGVQGLAPYMWELDGTLFISEKGDVTARVEGEYDQKITQRLIVQPRVEMEFSAQDIPKRDTGAGIVKVEAGLRLRYELAREFAPYIGVGYEARLGQTAEIARAAGKDPDGIALLLGIRGWF
ncbi:MAG: copper-binding protein [Citromicrobium sp.]|nr:MAG: copper-binding protein [Citromicrobium sp.]